MQSLSFEIPGWETVKAEARKWIKKILILKKNLFGAREDIKIMRNVLSRYPQNVAIQQHRSAILELDKNQGKYESKFFEIEGRFLQLLDYLGIQIPGLGYYNGLGEIITIATAVAIISALVILYASVSSHLVRVAERKALIAKLTPEEAKKELEKPPVGGFFGEAKNLVLLGIVASILVPMLTRRS